MPSNAEKDQAMNQQEWSRTVDRYIAEGRTVSGAKHDTEKKQADEDRQRNIKMQDKAFNAQMDTLQNLKTGLMKYVTGNEGFDPAMLAALKTRFLSTNAKDFSSARSNVKGALAAMGGAGGDSPVGGDTARALSGLYGAEASSLSSGLTGINLQNLQQALTNKFNAGSILSGNAATLSSPVSTFGAGINAAGERRTQLGLAPTFGSSFFNSLGTTLGTGIGKMAGGGISKGLGSIFGGSNG